MKLSDLLSDEDAVSPVIGVILMVAITVILAAVIGTFVLGLGDQVSSSAPQASFSFDFTDEQNSCSAGSTDCNNDTLTVTHDGGDSIPADQLNASVSGAENGNTSTSLQEFGGDLFSGSSDVSAGTSDTLSDGDFNYASSDPGIELSLDAATVRVTWTASDGSKTQTLGKWEGPDA